MTDFSANLGFLWADLPLPDAIRAAAKAGFDAVECHWPYDTPPGEVRTALKQTGLPMLGLNTIRGNPGENGLAALPGREAEARAAIDQALEYALQTGTRAVHVMPGFAKGKAARDVFLENLRHACLQARDAAITILIEPLNHHDAPGYFLQTTTQALGILDDLNDPGLKLMFDCYHVQIMEGDLTRRLRDCLPHIGHVQFASVPDRREPSEGEINYAHIFAELGRLGYAAPLGAEYKPEGPTEASLGWLQPMKAMS